MLLCNTYTKYPSRFKRPFNKGKREKIKESILLRGISLSENARFLFSIN